MIPNNDHGAGPLELPPFRPMPLAWNPHVQTIVASFGLTRPSPSVLETVELPDGDRIALEVSTPERWRDSDPTVVLIHGLCGCSRSAYMVRLSRRLSELGLRSVRMNLRGCGQGSGLARQIYHSGRSDDALAVLRSLRERSPSSTITLVGFSLGGNIALKLAGEQGEAGRGILGQVCAVSPPIDLKACSQKLSRAPNGIYERTFVKLLLRDVARRHRVFPELPAPRLPRRLRLLDFDNLYTAPQCGFMDAFDYYDRSSSGPLLGRVAVPTAILFAADDPLIDAESFQRFELSPAVRLHRTERGGHLGFLGRPGSDGGLRWMDELLIRWITEVSPGESP